MKRACLVALVIASLLSIPRKAFAQTPSYRADHLELGIWGEFYHFDQADLNLAGVGARLSGNVTPLVQLEAEMGYDFSRVFIEKSSNGAITALTSTRRIDGLFGPKLETNHGPVRFFLTAKGGATSFGFSSLPVTFGNFFSSVGNLRTQDVIAEFYPGGGIEGFIGPIGLRVDVGDEMYFASGTYHNFRLTFGPTIRF